MIREREREKKEVPMRIVFGHLKEWRKKDQPREQSAMWVVVLIES